MADIRFYHLQTQSVEDALPAIIAKARAGGLRILIRTCDEATLREIDDHLWTYHPEAFLPHGIEGSIDEELQPVLLSLRAVNPNGANVLILCGAETVPENIAEFSLCCDFIDGRDPASVEAGRTRWTEYKEAGHSLTYWQQNEQGGWEQKA